MVTKWSEVMQRFLCSAQQCSLRHCFLHQLCLLMCPAPWWCSPGNSETYLSSLYVPGFVLPLWHLHGMTLSFLTCFFYMLLYTLSIYKGVVPATLFPAPARKGLYLGICIGYFTENKSTCMLLRKQFYFFLCLFEWALNYPVVLAWALQSLKQIRTKYCQSSQSVFPNSGIILQPNILMSTLQDFTGKPELPENHSLLSVHVFHIHVLYYSCICIELMLWSY